MVVATKREATKDLCFRWLICEVIGWKTMRMVNGGSLIAAQPARLDLLVELELANLATLYL